MRRSRKASCRAPIKSLTGANHDQDAGIKIVLRALEEPLRAIAANAGDEPSVIIAKFEEGRDNHGYNAATGEYDDLVEIDPAQVTRTALQNVASVAGLILTTDASVAEAPKPEKAEAPAMPEMGY